MVARAGRKTDTDGNGRGFSESSRALIKLFTSCFYASPPGARLKDMLKVAARYTGAGYVAVYRKSASGYTLSAEYRGADARHLSKGVKLLSSSEHGDYKKLFNSEGVFLWDGSGTIPAKLESFLTEREIRSVFQFAVKEKGEFAGFVSFSFFTKDTSIVKKQYDTLALYSGIIAATALYAESARRTEYVENFLYKVMDSLAEWIYVMDADSCTVRYMNRTATEVYNFPKTYPCPKLKDKSGSTCSLCPVRQYRAVQGRECYDRNLGKWIEYSGAPVQWYDVPRAYLIIGSDVTLRRRYEMELERLAYYDSLVNIKNRMSCMKDMEVLCSDIRRKTVSGAILLIDIVGFKYINTTFGQHSGDEILQKIGAYLCSRVSAQDVYRIAGDRFLLILRDRSKEEVKNLTDDLYRRFSGSWTIGKASVSCKIWTAVLFYPGTINTSDDVFRALDHTIAFAKKTNAKELVVFDKEQDQRIQRNGYIVHMLKEAMQMHTVSTWYQPVYDVESGKFVKAEALARLTDGRKGMVSPAEFIPLAEQTGSITDIGVYMLEQVCRKIAELERGGIPIECINVNISPVQFMQEGFSGMVQEIVKKYAVNPAKLELEITESVLIASLDRVRRIMKELASNGFKFALDDFGTGYSSLNYLLELPIDTLKIDRSFICRIENDDNSRKMLKNILNMAEDLHIHTIAEGIETEKQFLLVKELGCTYIQGYYFSRPLPEADFVKFLLNKR